MKLCFLVLLNCLLFPEGFADRARHAPIPVSAIARSLGNYAFKVHSIRGNYCVCISSARYNLKWLSLKIHTYLYLQITMLFNWFVWDFIYMHRNTDYQLFEAGSAGFVQRFVVRVSVFIKVVTSWLGSPELIGISNWAYVHVVYQFSIRSPA